MATEEGPSTERRIGAAKTGAGLGDASARTGAPANALAVVMFVAVGTVVGLRINGTSSTNVFFYMGTIGVLSLLVAYIVTNLGAAKFLLLDRRENPLQLAIFTVAIGALVYVEYKNVHGIPFPYDRFPYVVLGWLALAVAIMVVFPRLVRRIGENLTRAEGIERPPPAACIQSTSTGSSTPASAMRCRRSCTPARRLRTSPAMSPRSPRSPGRTPERWRVPCRRSHRSQ